MEQKQSETESKLSFRQLFWYFLIFSIIGLIIETTYCYVTTGVLESRKGLLWGPFCPVYGIGATVLILALNRYRKRPIVLFLFGMLVGSVVEYILSFLLEALYGTRFWEYSYLPFNLNGRICLTYAIFWGILGLALIRIIKPILDRALDKIPVKVQNILQPILLIFLVIDAIATIWGIAVYKEKAICLYSQEELPKRSSALVRHIEESLFSDAKMKETFPNLRFIDKNGKEVWIRDIMQ